MKKTLQNTQLVEMMLDWEARMKAFYATAAERGHQGLSELLNFMVRQKDSDHRRLKNLVLPFLQTAKPSSDHDALFSLYVAPYLETERLSGFTDALEAVNMDDPTAILTFGLNFERDTLLVVHGLKEVLPEELDAILDDVLEHRRNTILQLQDGVRELSAGLDELFVVALNRELLARRFYLDAAGKAESQAGKKFFSEFADFEMAHYEKMKQIIEARHEGAKLALPEPGQEMRGLDPEIKGEFEPNKDEIIDVILMAIEAEKGAQARYRKIADMLEGEEESALFLGFANDERVHQRILEEQLYQMSNQGMIIWE